ncbi:MAG TPA: tetratricopeptide repeat protein [Acidobacteriota bacterium]|nr:tetratricopeptide repeat protein [Acidobacteriota bacterium]
MKKIALVMIISAALFACAKNDSRLPGDPSYGGSSQAASDEPFRSLPGDENVKSSEVAYNLALEHAGARNMQAAHHFIDLAMKLESHPKYSYMKGMFYLGEKRYEKALLWLDKSMRENPAELQARLDIWNAQGIVLMQLKRYEEAKVKFRNIVNTEGLINRFNAYYNLGRIYLDENNMADAESVFRKAQEENPNDYRVHAKLGKIALARNDYVSAESDYSKAGELVEQVFSALQADGPEIYYSLGEALLRQQKTGEARTALLKVIKIAPEGEYGLKAKDILSKLPPG